jgi:superfamily II DNA or RNA helicase
MHLRDYQEHALQAILDAWASGIEAPAVVAPTGAGKTVMFAELTRRLRELGERVVILVHRDELARQTRGKLVNMGVAADDVGTVKAELDEVDKPVVVASIQTLARDRRLRRLLDAGPVDTAICDEAHHAAAASWRKVLRALGCKRVGFSATLSRTDHLGLAEVWDKVVFEREVLDFVRQGILAPPRGLTVRLSGFTTAGVKRGADGDTQAADVGQRLLDANAGPQIAQAWQEHAPGRRTILFAPTVETARAFAASFRSAGIATETVTGDTPADERQAIYHRFQTGETMVLTNCMVLTEGFDAPWAQCVINARATVNVALWIQMIGRGLRPWPGKKDCVVLDVSGAAASGKLKLASCTSIMPDQLDPDDPDAMCGCACECACRCTVLRCACHPDRCDGCPCPHSQERDEMAGGEGGLRLAEGQDVGELGELDLFSGGRYVWLLTDGGIPFLQDAGRLWYCWPDLQVAGQFWPGHCSERTTTDRTWLASGPMPFDAAALRCEEELDELRARGGESFNEKGRRWRSGRPSAAQLAMAGRLGLDVPEGATKGQLSEMISRQFASKVLDGRARAQVKAAAAKVGGAS